MRRRRVARAWPGAARLAGRAARARRSRSSGRSRARATSSRATPRGCPWTPRAACAWPRPRAPLARPRGALRLGAGPRRQGRALRGHRQRRQGLPHRGRQGHAASSTPPSWRSTRWPSGPTARLYVGHLAGRQGLRGRRARARPRPSSIPTDKYIWALAFDRKGSLLVATGAEGRIHRVDREGQGARSLLDERRDPHHRARRRRRAATSTRAARPGGILYRIDPAGKVFVLHDSPFREVKALDVGARRQPLRRGHRRQGAGRAARPRRRCPPCPPPPPARRRRSR